MSIEIKVPDMGESVIEATVARWIKQPGEPVRSGEAVVELETDKVNLEVGSPHTGTLQEILRQTGETVAVGDVLALVAAAGDAPPASPAEPAKDAASPPAQSAAPQALPPAPVAAQATPVAQRMAHELGIDLKNVQPTGSGGRITKEDVQAFASKPAEEKPAPAPPPAAAVSHPAAPAQPAQPLIPARYEPEPVRTTRIRMTRRRQTIARRLVEAQHTAAMLTTFNEVDMNAIIDLRKRRREGFKERYGVDLGFMPFFVKASIGALKAFPYLNAEIVQNESGADEILLKHYYDIGIAIGAQEGLVVPVIRGAERLSFAEIEQAIRDYAAKAKANTLTLEDLHGGSFTITNGGVFGSLLSTPILNPPQVGILGMHKIQERPVVVNGEIVIRSMMYLALSYDHRIVDGREAVQFLVRLKELVEDPEALLFS